MPDREMTPQTLTAIRSRLNSTYTGYSIGCAGVWAALLATGRRLLDAKEMAENIYRALWAWSACVIVTVMVSLVTKPKPESELVGLVYGATEIPHEPTEYWYQNPIVWAMVIFVIFVALNIMFW